MNDDVTQFSVEPEVLTARSDQSTVDAMDELKALTEVMQALRGIASDAARSRILVAAAAFFKLDIGSQRASDTTVTSMSRPTHQDTPKFSDTRTVSPKEFLLEKQPKSDVERVACLAYFLTHHRDTPHFKTVDISKINTEAAQPKFSNAARSVDNATSSRYLVPASKGNKQLSAVGELFVQALPDRDAAKNAMAVSRSKKRRKVATRSDFSESTEPLDEGPTPE